MRRTTLVDRFDDFCRTWFDKVKSIVDGRQATEKPRLVTYKWWFVANRVTTGMVVTDQAQCIVIAPLAWNRFVGMTLDVLLGQVSARAVPLPGPYADPR